MPDESPDAGEEPDAGAPDMGVPDAGVVEYRDEFSSGPLSVTPDGTTLGYTMLQGRAGMIREETGYTSVVVFARGLKADSEYSVHVHARSCDQDGGGPHYKIDTEVMEVMAENEIWPNITTDADGNGTGYLRVSHFARADAQSIVIHETGSTERIACATLAPNADATANGTFYELPNGVGSGLTGTATLRRYMGGTVATARLMGTFTSTSPYPVHVHAKRCADEQGGPHYKIDTEVSGTVPENEIWPSATPNGMMALGTAMTPHIARHDAWSMVVHQPGTGERLLCADLRW